MNEWKLLENHLRCWTPRRPSARLESQLFGRHGAPTGRAAAGSARDPLQRPAAWHWLAPALAAFVVGLFMIGYQPPRLAHLSSPWPTGLAAEVALAHPNVAAWIDNSHRSDRNRWLAATFDWTNGSHSLTTSPLIFSTNGALP